VLAWWSACGAGCDLWRRTVSDTVNDPRLSPSAHSCCRGQSGMFSLLASPQGHETAVVSMPSYLFAL
jgi:hypothetical protein